jgi:hypothetical protein
MFVSALALGCVAGSIEAQTQSIALNDPSFELPQIAPPGPGSTAADVVLPFFVGWQETGALTTEQGFTGLLDAGVFLNIPFDLGGGNVIPAIPNADGNQLAYMRFNTAAGVTAPATTISQAAAEPFEPFSDYEFTMAIGNGTLQPAGASDPNDPFTVVLSIGFYNDDATVASGFTALSSATVASTDLNLDGSLKDFSVILSTDDAIFDRQVVVHVEQSGGSTGSVNLDNARLTRTFVPEPTSLALLGLGGLMLTRRRR